MALRNSNTTTTQIDTRTFIDRCYGSLKLRPQQITGEMIQIALDMIGLVQQDLMNDSMPIWTLRKELMTLVQGQNRYVMPTGTNDVESVFFRTINNVTPNSTATLGSAAVQFQFPVGGSQVSSLAVTFPGAVFPITIQTSPDGATWSTVYTSTIYDMALNGSPIVWYDPFINAAAVYWQVIPSTINPVTGTVIAPPNTMTGVTAQVYNTPVDIMMYRMNRDDAFQLPNKAFQGRPLQYRFDRQINPVIETWPTPDLFSSQMVMVAYRQRLILDAGSLQQSLEIPSRWYLPFLYMVAAELAFCTPEVDPAITGMIQQKSKDMRNRAWLEDRDKSPVKFQTNIGIYTR